MQKRCIYRETTPLTTITGDNKNAKRQKAEERQKEWQKEQKDIDASFSATFFSLSLSLSPVSFSRLIIFINHLFQFLFFRSDDDEGRSAGERLVRLCSVRACREERVLQKAVFDMVEVRV